MASTVFFNGRSTSTPQTQSVVDDSAEAPPNPTVGNVLAIVGTCTGGQPNTPLAFGDPSEVAAVLVDGPLCYAVQKAFSASTETNAPSTVIAMRVGQATPATLTLNDANGNPSIALTSVQYGTPANLTKVKVEAGTTAGLRVTTQVGQTYYVQDNLFRNALYVAYQGTAATATVTIGTEQVILSAPVGTVVGTINLVDCPTVGQLCDYISAVPGFSGVAVAGSENTPSLLGLDNVTGADCKTSFYTVTATLQAVVEWLNGLGQAFVTAVRPPAAVLPPALVPFTYLTGGSAPAPVFSDWTNALNVLQTSDVQHVVPLSGDPAVHAATDAHVQYMSTVARKERRAYVGPAAGTSLAAVEALPINLDSDRTALCWPGYYDFNAAGVNTLYDPFYTAVLVASGFAGSNPGTPMTNKTVTARGLETKIRNPTDTDALINAGVLCLEETTEGYKVVRSISTWLANNNYNRVEVSTGIATDFMVRTVREAVDPLRGNEATPQALSRAISQADTALKGLAKPQPLGPGVIVGDDNSPAYQNIQASITGDVLALSWTASPVIPLNFIECATAIVPYSGTATATATA